MIYLDNHATTSLDPVVLDAMLPYQTKDFGNASSSHRLGLVAGIALEDARQTVADILAVSPSSVYFTSGATESNNTVIKGVFLNAARRGVKEPHFIIPEIEHKCVLEAARYIESLGAEITKLKVDKLGFFKLDDLESAIKPSTLLVSVMMANNEIGVLNPITEIVRICHKKKVLVHTDAAQALGKIPVKPGELGVDMMSSSAHKHYGPKGVGLLYLAQDARPLVDPIFHGGGQEGGMRSGTSNIPGIVGLSKSMQLFCGDEYIKKEMKRQKDLVAALYQGLLQIMPDLHLNGPELGQGTRLTNNLNVVMPSVNQKIFNKKIKGLMVSSGSACSSADLKPSYVLTALGLSDEMAFRSYRFGLSKNTTAEEITAALEIMKEAYEIARIS